MLSIIIPVYNSAFWLEACVNSILRSALQYPWDFEIILVNDGSTDGSAEICEGFKSKDSRIVCFHQENAGVSAARNVGLQLAKGEYICWVDSDDTISEDWFPDICNVIAQEAPDVIFFDSIRQEKDRDTPEIYGRQAGKVEKEVFFSDIARDIRMLSGLPNKVIRAKYYQNIQFGKEKILEDYNHIFQILDQADSFYYIPKVLYYYRQLESSIIHTSTPEQSFFCVETALRRKESLPDQYQNAAVVGVAVQMVRFCRARGYDERYLVYAKEYRFCKSYISQNLHLLWADSEVPFRWKLKFLLVKYGILPILVRIKK